MRAAGEVEPDGPLDLHRRHAEEERAGEVARGADRGLGDGFLAPYDYYNATDGLRSVVAALSSGLSTVTAHTAAPLPPAP